MSVLRATSIAVALACTAGAAAAQEVAAGKPASLVAALQAAGYQARLSKDGVGDPLIESRAGGHRFQVFFFGCTKGADCSQVQLSAGFVVKTKPTLEQVNTWNADKAITKVSVDKDGDPYLRAGLWLKQPVSQSYIRGLLELWDSSLAAFVKEFVD